MSQINAGYPWMAERGMITARHPPYSPDLAPCDFFLFPHMKDGLRGIRFQSTKEMKKASENFLKGQLRKEFKVFQEWEQCMKKCVRWIGIISKEIKFCNFLEINTAFPDTFS